MKSDARYRGSVADGITNGRLGAVSVDVGHWMGPSVVREKGYMWLDPGAVEATLPNRGHARCWSGRLGARYLRKGSWMASQVSEDTCGGSSLLPPKHRSFLFPSNVFSI